MNTLNHLKSEKAKKKKMKVVSSNGDHVLKGYLALCCLGAALVVQLFKTKHLLYDVKRWWLNVELCYCTLFPAGSD